MSIINRDPKKIREDVSSDYTHAVSVGSCCGDNVPKGVIVKIAGYTEEELNKLPADAVVNSFGCGNPLAFSEVKAGETVLDLGSGAGIDVLIAALKVGPKGKVIGVDMTDTMIQKARANIGAAGLKNAEIRKGIIEELPVESGSVDWVISNCVINLSPEKHRVFAEIARVLKPGGTMLVSDIVAEKLPDEVKKDRGLYSSCLAGAISESEYLKGLCKVGLKDAEVCERLVYDSDQLAGFIGSELKEDDSCGCCGSSAKIDQTTATRWANELQGKIWSAKFKAHKSN